MSQTYPFQLKPLPYAYDALTPYIDEETVRIHHDKHQQTYVNNLNAALEKAPQYQGCTLEQLLLTPERIDAESRTAIMRNAGGVYNHEHYFDGMTPNAPEGPSGQLMNGIMQYFGSFMNFKKSFTDAALSVFGSGYAFLVAPPEGWLQIITLPNQETPVQFKFTTIMTLDVWEHAYYLDYQNKRADYLENWWNLVNWNNADAIYEEVAMKNKRFDFDDMPK